MLRGCHGAAGYAGVPRVRDARGTNVQGDWLERGALWGLFAFPSG